jgi:hypothetical protein
MGGLHDLAHQETEGPVFASLVVNDRLGIGF